MAQLLPPIPKEPIEPESHVWREWFNKVRNVIVGAAQGVISWASLNFDGSNITDIVTRNHNDLQTIQGGTSGQYYHLTATQLTNLGTVTTVSVATSNGFAGTVATATTTPVITLKTSVTGLLKGNGTAISAATSGTDYAPATSGTSILYGNGSGGFSNVTIGTGVSFAAGTLSATGSGGTVTSVTGTAPVASSGGTTPAISLNTGYGDTLNPYASKTANYVLAAPNGSTGVPTFRALVAADIPTLSYVPYTGAASAVDLNAQSLTNISHLGVNTTTVPTILARFFGDNNSSSRIAVRGYSSDANSSSMRVTKFRGAYATPQAPQNGDSLGKFELAGYGTTSSDGYPQVSFEGVATENWSAIARGAKTLIKVTPNTTTAQVTAVTIDQDKSVTFATTATATTFIGALTGTASGNVTSVTGTAPVVSSGGTTPAISMAAATASVSGYLTSTDWTTFNNKGSGTVTSVAAITLGTTGTDLSSTVATGTTTPVITLQVPTASASNRGALSAADWTTFNGKGSGSVTSVAQSFTGGLISVAGSPITTSGTLALTVAGTSGGIPYFSSASTWATSAALAASSIVIGGGAGAAPSTTTTGTGVVTALGVNTGSAGAFVVNGGALGTPLSGTVTNLTGTASININGTVGATTRNTGLFTTLGANSAVTLSGAAASVHTLGTSATTGTVTIGGTAMTGTLTFGQSTTTNAVNINTGVTASGNTKSTYIGTNGAAGSTSAVEIGSTLGTSTVLANGRLLASRTTAASLPGFRCYGTSTDQNYIQIDSTGGGQTALGVNGSVGAELGTGTTAYATVLGSYVNVPVEIVVNNAKVASFSSTGLNSTAIGATTPSTGAFTTLSATGDATLCKTSGNITAGLASGAGTLKLDIYDSSLTSTTIGANRVARIGSNANGGDCTLHFTDSVAYNSYISAKANHFYIQPVGGTSVADFSSTGLAVTGTLSATGVVTFSNYGAGAATFSAAGVISSVSDETWKVKDGVPVDPDAMINKLEPGYWYYNDEKKETFGKDRQLGFYAQNVNAAIGPEAAPEPEEGKPWGYYDRSVLAVTVMSLQKALATIESLTARITAMENK